MIIEFFLLIVPKRRSNSPGAKSLNDAVSPYAARTKHLAVAFNEEPREM
jgi:hypothetical protein